MELNENFFDYDGNLLRYLSAGDGEKQAILMHGFHFKAETWEESKTIDTFVKNGYEVFSLDMPNFPNSKSKFEIDEDEIVKLIAEFAQNYINGRFTLLGASASGYIAIKYALEYQDTLEKLILVAPADYPETTDTVKTRTLLIYGSNDPLIKQIDNVKKLFTNQVVYIIEGAGHACYLNRSKEFNELIDKFLKNSI